MRRFVIIAAAVFLPFFEFAPARACPRAWDYPCHRGERLGMLGAEILTGFASNPPIPGTTWGLSPSGRIVPVPIGAHCPRYRRCWR